jgi:FMN phosphatase YigB (HAD superfamily)
LNEHDLPLRHRVVVDRALRAARFDVRSGRISRDTFYDAILRVHGVEDENLLPLGRVALLQDAADIELFPGVRETLVSLQLAGYRLGVVSDTAHSAREKSAWLAARGIPVELWAAFIVSSEVGSVKPGREIFEWALKLLGADWAQTAYVGHDSNELSRAAELGMTTIAFMPDDPAVETDHVITSFYGLQTLLLPRSLE